MQREDTNIFHRAYKIRLCGHLRRYKKIVKKTYMIYINELKIKTPSAEQLISKLSGGNQQKVIVARQLCINPKILLLDEPTQGIDIGSKSDIYQLIQNLACSGMAIIVVSSELIEICNISSRIIVMRDGKIAGEVAKEDISEENVTRLAMGVSK